MLALRRNTLLLLVGLVAATATLPVLARGAVHDPRFDHRHPRRDHVLDRTQMQNRRITRQVHQGELTHAQAHRLRRNDARIVRREQMLARHNGGYITKKQEAHLNRRLNANSKRIGN